MNRKWTADEEEELKKCWGCFTVSEISNKLNRSETAIRSKANSLKLGKWIDGGELIGVKQLCLIIGYKSYWRQLKKFEKNNFPFICKRINKNKMRCVKIDSFWKWAEQHQDLLNFSQLEEYSLGAEPRWVKEKRKKDREKSIGFLWTPEEEQKLTIMLRLNYPIVKITKELNRGETSIKSKADRMGIKTDFKYNKIDWDSQEVEKLKQSVMLYDSIHDLTIKEFSYRTETSVRKKIYRVYGTTNLKKIKEGIINRDDNI